MMFKRSLFLLVGLLCGLPLVYGQQSQAPEWKHGLEFRVRKAGEPDFTKDTKRYGLEVFKDENTGQLVYICETGSIATVPAGTVSAPREPKPPTFVHGLELKCRKGGELDFTPATKKYGLEVFKDENTGNLVYITETGMIAVIPGSGITPPAKVKGPTWLHGLEFRVRKADEPNFTKDTRNFGAELFKDENTNHLVYVTEVGAIAVVPGSSAATETKAPKFLHGLDLKCRRAGEPDFTKETKRWGVEVFQDPNTGLNVYIAETGSLAVPAK